MQINNSGLEVPKWHKDLEIYENIKTAYIVDGNVHDLQAWVYEEEGLCELVSLNEYFYRFLGNYEYDIIIFYNRVDGFYNQFSKAHFSKFFELINKKPEDCKTFEDASIAIRIALDSKDYAVAVIFDMVNTSISSPESPTETELECLSRLFLASKKRMQATSKRSSKVIINKVFYIVEKNNDIPAWFYLNNPYIKTISIAKPSKDIRKSLIYSNKSVFYDLSELTNESLEKSINDLALLTEGLSNVELFGVLTLCKTRKISALKMKQAVNLYKYGVTTSQWDKLDEQLIRNATVQLSRRVKGQPEALFKVSNIISRAFLGLSGIQGNSFDKPKGILFFAGPTGTGKTELAKAIAELIFGDEKFVTRFDMSEYGQSHSDQKLLGAPPGYIGYGSGGQLTNAVKEKPFSVLLFDEIDKADPSILDKFLQILEDGRMTDSTGETVYFSETLIIFTSNLGMIRENHSTGVRFQNITPDMDYVAVKQKVMDAVTDFFKFRINRPELLNRIGDNFVIFDFIRPDSVDEILKSKIDKLIQNFLEERQITLVLSDKYHDFLKQKSMDNLENGGRGIGNVVESHLINLLSQILIHSNIPLNSKLLIDGIKEDGELQYSIETASERDARS